MGTCQSDPSRQEDQIVMQTEEMQLEDNSHLIVLGQWKHDQCDGTNQPNALEFGKSNQSYQSSHNNFMQHNQSSVSRNSQVNDQVMTKYVPPSGASSQRVSVFSGYSQVDRTKAVQKENDIQRRPINLTRRNIF